MADFVNVLQAGNHAVCTLSQPHKRNPLSAAMRHALIAALEPLQRDPAIRSVIITGEGSAFCSGLDLDGMTAQQQLSAQEHLADSSSIRDFFEYIYQYPKPLIAAVNGPAVAGGFGLALVCDFMLIAQEAFLSFSEVKIGFVPAIVSVYLRGMVPEKLARDLLLTGRKLSAAEAESIGLAMDAVPASELMFKAAALADNLCLNSPMAVASTKKLLVHMGDAQRR